VTASVNAGVTREDGDMAIIKPTDMITVVEGYDAMRIFLETVWQRQGKSAGEIELLIGGLKWADGSPVNPTLWEDWLAAAQVVCNCRTHEIIDGEN
jgi:hypothetical protein